MKVLTLSAAEDAVGQELGVSDWLLVDQARIDAFAEVTGDHQWIHVDVPRATRELGGTIAHGFLTLSLMATLAPQVRAFEDAGHSLNYGFDRIRFISPVPSGSRIRLRQTLRAVQRRPDAGVALTFDSAVEIEGRDRPV